MAHLGAKVRRNGEFQKETLLNASFCASKPSQPASNICQKAGVETQQQDAWNISPEVKNMYTIRPKRNLPPSKKSASNSPLLPPSLSSKKRQGPPSRKKSKSRRPPPPKSKGFPFSSLPKNERPTPPLPLPITRKDEDILRKKKSYRNSILFSQKEMAPTQKRASHSKKRLLTQQGKAHSEKRAPPKDEVKATSPKTHGKALLLTHQERGLLRKAQDSVQHGRWCQPKKPAVEQLSTEGMFCRMRRHRGL